MRSLGLLHFSPNLLPLSQRCPAWHHVIPVTCPPLLVTASDTWHCHLTDASSPGISNYSHQIGCAIRLFITTLFLFNQKLNYCSSWNCVILSVNWTSHLVCHSDDSDMRYAVPGNTFTWKINLPFLEMTSVSLSGWYYWGWGGIIEGRVVLLRLGWCYWG